MTNVSGSHPPILTLVLTLQRDIFYEIKQTLTSSLYNVSHSYRLAAIELLFRHFSKTFVAAELEVCHDVRRTDKRCGGIEKMMWMATAE
jgi:hypothetical protein